jgi:hypothetical protein
MIELTYAQWITLLFRMASEDIEPLLAWAIKTHACGVVS